MKRMIAAAIPVFLAASLMSCFPKEEENNSMLLLLLAAAAGSNAGSGVGSCTIGSGMTAAPQTQTAQTKPPPLDLSKAEYVPGEVLVKYKDSASDFAVQSSLASRGLSVKESLHLGTRKGSKLQLVKTTRKLATVLSELKADPNVEFAQPNFIYHALETTPNDTDFGKLWGLNNTGQTVDGVTGTANVDIDAPAAWDTVTDCSSVVVAVLDSGVNYNHEDLSANMWDGTSCKTDTGGALGGCTHGYDYVQGDKVPMDLNGHGTHVAGTIGGAGNNSKGMTGVCWNPKIMAVRVLDTTGSGSTANIVKGVNFAVQNGAKVINASLGGGSSDSAFSTAIDNARTAGVIFVAAAGNSSSNNDTTPSYPASYSQDNIIAVAAIDQNGNLASFSNYGATSVDIAAPGVNIYSSWPGTHTTIDESALSGWTTSARWGVSSQTYGSSTFNMVTNHSNWYVNGYNTSQTNERAYKTFNLSGSDAVIFSFYLDINIAAGDTFSVRYSSTGGSPGSTIQSYTNVTTSGYLTPLTFEVSSCANAASCSLGFDMTTDATFDGKIGAGIGYPSVKTLALNNTSYNTIDGTSMAAPHVAGLAALLIAKKPSATYSQIIQAIYNGGISRSSLNGYMLYPKLINADCALRNLQ